MNERPFFLTDDEMRQLTGRAVKAKQIEWLKVQGLPFRISATGHPVVVRSAIDGSGGATAAAPRRTWQPSLAEI